MPRQAYNPSPPTSRGFVEKTGWDGKKVRQYFTITRWDKDYYYVVFESGDERKIKRSEVRFF
jgi:hypothetical protein